MKNLQCKGTRACELNRNQFTYETKHANKEKKTHHKYRLLHFAITTNEYNPTPGRQWRSKQLNWTGINETKTSEDPYFTESFITLKG